MAGGTGRRGSVNGGALSRRLGLLTLAIGVPATIMSCSDGSTIATARSSVAPVQSKPPAVVSSTDFTSALSPVSTELAVDESSKFILPDTACAAADELAAQDVVLAAWGPLNDSDRLNYSSNTKALLAQIADRAPGEIVDGALSEQLASAADALARFDVSKMEPPTGSDSKTVADLDRAMRAACQVRLSGLGVLGDPNPSMQDPNADAGMYPLDDHKCAEVAGIVWADRELAAAAPGPERELLAMSIRRAIGYLPYAKTDDPMQTDSDVAVLVRTDLAATTAVDLQLVPLIAELDRLFRTACNFGFSGDGRLGATVTDSVLDEGVVFRPERQPASTIVGTDRVCALGDRLALLSSGYVLVEGFEFGRRDRTSVEIRTTLVAMRAEAMQPGAMPDQTQANQVIATTRSIDGADFHESGDFTDDQRHAVLVLDQLLRSACGIGLPSYGVLSWKP